MRIVRGGLILAGVTLLVALTACAPSPADTSSPAALEPSSTPDSVATSSPNVPATPTPHGEISNVSEDVSPCADVAPQHPVPAAEPEQIGGMSLLIPLDRGPSPYASGAATLAGNGVPVAYTVASNDNFDAVAARFCVGPIWLYWVNAVRRDGNGQTLYAGDTLNLDAHTIRTVGDQNGIVYDNPLPEGFTIPPQR